MGDPQGYWRKVMVVIGANGGDGGDGGDGVRYTRYETTMVMSDVEVLIVSHLCAYSPLLAGRQPPCAVGGGGVL